MKLKWLKLLWVVVLLGSCFPQDELRVATPTLLINITTQNPNKTTSPPASQSNGLETPTPYIVGNFVTAPIIFNTLPVPGTLPTTTPVTGEFASLEDSSVGEENLSAISIAALASRTYGQDAGTLTFESTLENTGGFTRVLFSYPSDGLKIYGFINIPLGLGPFPVVIFVHGYVNPVLYETLDYSVRYADDLARRGLIVVHPNLRGYPPSDNGPDLFETGKAIDVLNLATLIQRDAGTPGLLEQANPDKIALWGHSTGGGIAIRAVTVNLPSATGPGPTIKAAILYAPMSGDEAKNAYRSYYVFTQPRWEYEVSLPVEALQPISPAFFYDQIEAAVQVHHGALDELVPIEWSRETCAQMQEAGVTVECYEYRTQAHNFCCDSYKWMLDRLVSFLFVHMP
jgi:dienelactone hydrolase